MKNVADAMSDADFVLIDGIMCETAYVRVPDEFTVPDDVVLEVTHGDDEFAFLGPNVAVAFDHVGMFGGPPLMALLLSSKSIQTSLHSSRTTAQ